MATFQERLKHAIGARGYEHCMRRSVQTVILFEAHRCISDKLPSLRPFQRKLAFFDQAMALLEGTNLLPHQKDEVMWRTGTSREHMQPDTAWKRMKLIEKEVEKLIEKIKPLCVDGKSHEDVCRDYIRQQYEIVSGQKGKPFPSNWDHSQPFPSNWEHSHNNVFLTYRMYYSGTERDTTFPPPEPPKEIVVPASKPKTGVDAAYYVAMNSAGNGGDAGERNIAGVSGVEPEPAEERRQILHEVRLHLDLLKEFEGIIPAETLNKRKRELFAAVPSAPPSTVSRGKLQSMGVAKKPRAEI